MWYDRYVRCASEISWWYKAITLKNALISKYWKYNLPENAKCSTGINIWFVIYSETMVMISIGFHKGRSFSECALDQNSNTFDYYYYCVHSNCDIGFLGIFLIFSIETFHLVVLSRSIEFQLISCRWSHNVHISWLDLGYLNISTLIFILTSNASLKTMSIQIELTFKCDSSSCQSFVNFSNFELC